MYFLEVKCYESTDKGVLNSGFGVREGGPIAVALICRISATRRKEERAYQEGRAIHSDVRRYNVCKKQLTAWC